MFILVKYFPITWQKLLLSFKYYVFVWFIFEIIFEITSGDLYFELVKKSGPGLYEFITFPPVINIEVFNAVSLAINGKKAIKDILYVLFRELERLRVVVYYVFFFPIRKTYKKINYKPNYL